MCLVIGVQTDKGKQWLTYNCYESRDAEVSFVVMVIQKRWCL